MSQPSRPSTPTNDLIELAAIDALGLLDEHERRAFDDAFSASAPHVQAHVRREQQRMIGVSDTLPQVEPPASLRGRVLAAVRDAMLSSPASVDLSGRAGRWGVLTAWRAAAIAAATAAVVLGGFSMMITQENRAILASMQTQAGQDFLRMSPRMRELVFSENVTRYAFVPAAADVGTDAMPAAKFWIDETTRRAVFFADRLPEGSGEYTLVLRGDREGEFTRLSSVAASGGFASVSFDDFDPTSVSRLGLIGSPREGEPARLLMTVEAS